MTYYTFLLLDANRARSLAKRFFLWLGISHYVFGFVFMVLGALINWRFVILPAAWFLLGFLHGNIAYLFVTDYRYVYDNGTLTVLKRRRYGGFRPVLQVPLDGVQWQKKADKTVTLTNCQPTIRFVYNNVLYQITCDLYMASLIKGEHYVFGQCGHHTGA